VSGPWDDRLAEVWAAPGRAGAGVIVGSVGVLTARHVIAGALPGGRVLARVVMPGVSIAAWAPMQVSFESTEWDVALLTVDDAAQGRENWVRPTTSQPVIVRLGKRAERNCEAVGFPQSETRLSASANPSKTVRQTEQALGTVLPAGQGKPRADPQRELPVAWMPLDVNNATPGTQAGWGGMSGAGVVLPDGRLIGLVVAAEAEHQQRRLYLVPLAEVLDRDRKLGAVVGSFGAPLLVEARHAAQYRKALRESTLGADGLPRRIDQLRDLAMFGVKPADLPGEPTYLDYVARDEDDRLEQRLVDAIGQRRMLLVVGGSASGKSRSTAEAAARVLRQHRLLRPKFRDLGAVIRLPLADLLPAVVWLDDIQHYTHEALRDNLEQLLAAGAAVVATVRRKVLEELAAPGEVRNPAGDALSDKRLVDRVDWPLAWSSGERTRVSGKVGYPGLLRAIDKGMPLGVYCVAGPDLLRRIEDAYNDDEMIWRYALIRTVLDWYRTGIETPAPLTLVTELMPLVAKLEDYPLKEDVDDALEWFTRPVIGQGRQSRQSVITVLDTDSGPAAAITVHDYVLDHDHQDRGRTLIDEVWSAALQVAAVLDISARFRISATAYNQNRTDIALNEMKVLAEGGDALAMSSVGALILQNDPRSARDWLERALASGSPQAVPVAQANLGGLLVNAGETGRARELLEAAIGSESPQVVPLAQANLGGLLLNAGETGRARELLEAALRSGDPQAVPMAQANLGAVLMLAGETGRARELLEAAIGSGNPQVVPLAQANLGVVLVLKAGRPGGPGSCWRRRSGRGTRRWWRWPRRTWAGWCSKPGKPGGPGSCWRRRSGRGTRRRWRWPRRTWAGCCLMPGRPGGPGSCWRRRSGRGTRRWCR
jgi:tetratricopeptide (TPR) repeat protein